MKPTVLIPFTRAIDREKEIKIALMRSIQKLTDYKVVPSDLDIEFLFEEGHFITAGLKIPAMKGALQLLESLYTQNQEFTQKLASEFSSSLFEYLVLNNRAASIEYYSEICTRMNLTIMDYVVGEKFTCHFIL